ncbi:MAG: chemotaxis protein CheR [Gammaproteobacteria bacterium]|nr:chemotaxis protein CheR [Gammaproteobacteria bacterium]MDH5592985.1 chemotaxis protein CheR [Gammaproteobacteria bacterium]MDH5614004.1 chemotaxis protein CheR [Gammaproteobacteria bacterium]
MSQAEIESLLKKTMGLNSVSVGSATISRAVQKRMNSRGEPDINAYYHEIIHSRSELDKLIDEVIIPETWFFRDNKPFQALDQIVKDKYKKETTKGKKIRILSAPCSTGEEPYSIAMVMLNNGLRSDQFQIDAIDISSRNIEYASIGIYGLNSFRGDDIRFRDKYFIDSPEGYILDNSVKKSIKFERANLLDPSFKINRSNYDIIFCRNLLIYFDRQTQSDVLTRLSDLLNKDGTLFVGHAEGGALIGSWSPSREFPGAFAFSKPDPHVLANSLKNKSTSTGSIGITRKQIEEKPLARPFSSVTKPVIPANTQGKGKAHDLDTAAKLANEGHLVEAAKICEEHLRDKGPDTQAYFLLALVREATGNRQQAVDYLKKVIYLNPEHYEAMVHLSSLLELLGDINGSKNINERASRIKNKAS